MNNSVARFGQDASPPIVSDGSVIVKVEATGLCRSDWHGWMGHDPDIVLPHVPGPNWLEQLPNWLRS
jgi:D-arabinose 1-dehydrogenase-like Zn-dependent alcohol dehydrogenase